MGSEPKSRITAHNRWLSLSDIHGSQTQLLLYTCMLCIMGSGFLAEHVLFVSKRNWLVLISKVVGADCLLSASLPGMQLIYFAGAQSNDSSMAVLMHTWLDLRDAIGMCSLNHLFASKSKCVLAHPEIPRLSLTRIRMHL